MAFKNVQMGLGDTSKKKRAKRVSKGTKKIGRKFVAPDFLQETINRGTKRRVTPKGTTKVARKPVNVRSVQKPTSKVNRVAPKGAQALTRAALGRTAKPGIAKRTLVGGVKRAAKSAAQMKKTGVLKGKAAVKAGLSKEARLRRAADVRARIAKGRKK